MSKAYEKYFTDSGLSKLTGKQHRELQKLESDVGSFGLLTFILIIIDLCFIVSLFLWFNKITLFVTIIIAILILIFSIVTYYFNKLYINYLKNIFKNLGEEV